MAQESHESPNKRPPDPELMMVQDLIRDECDAIKHLLQVKNKSYGNAAVNPIRCFSKANPEEQINVRLDDKLSRIMRGNEFIGEDTELDLVGYLILKRVARKYRDLKERDRAQAGAT